MQRTALLVLCLAFIVSLTWGASNNNPGLSTTFTADDVTRAKNFLQSASIKTVDDAYYATNALAILQAKPSDSKAPCAIARDTLANKEVLEMHDARSIFHAASVIEHLRCDGVTVEKALNDAITTVIEDGDSFPHMYYAASAVLALRAAGVKVSIRDDDLVGVVAKINELTDEDGSILSRAGEKEGSVYNTGHALRLYARLLKDTKISEEDTEHINELADKIETIIDSGNEEEGKLAFESDKQSNLATTSSVVRGITEIATQLNKKVDAKAIDFTRIGEYLLSHKHSSSIEDTYHTISGLVAVQNNPVASPLALVVEKGSLLATAKGNEGYVRVRLSDILDKPVPASKVYLVKGHAVGSDKQVLTNQELVVSSDDSSAYTFNFLGAKPEQGFYALEFRAVPQGDNAKKFATIDSAIRRVKVIGSISVSDFQIVISDSHERAEGSRYKAEHPNKIEDQIKVDQTQHIFAQFKVKNSGGGRALVVQQAFLRFTNTITGHEAVFVAVPDENKLYTAHINLKEAAKPLFKHQSGEYRLDVVVGDAFIQNPVSWTVSPSVNLRFEAKSVSSPATNLAARPEIVHKFRESERRPGGIVSSFFTLLVLSPLALLFIGLLASGANLRRFPFSGPDFISAAAFVGSIASVLTLLFVYWLRLNLIQTLGYLLILAFPTVFFGQKSLSKLARRSKLE